MDSAPWLRLQDHPGGFRGKRGHVVSRDISEYKTDLIRQNLERMNRSNAGGSGGGCHCRKEKRTVPWMSLLWSWCYGKKREISNIMATPELQSITDLQNTIVAAGLGSTLKCTVYCSTVPACSTAGKSGDGSLDHRELPVCTGRREIASAGTDEN